MRQSIARFLRRLAEWLDPQHDPVVLERARALAAQAEVVFGPGFGEAKRHMVYARLIKDFPDKTRRFLSRLIEDAV